MNLGLLSGVVLGLGGIIASVLSAILVSKRAKEANTIANRALSNELYLKEKRIRVEVLSNEICILMDALSQYTLVSLYEIACILGDVAKNEDLSIQVNKNSLNISRLMTSVYLKMWDMDNDFYKKCLEVIDEYGAITSRIKLLGLYAAKKRMDARINPSVIPDDLSVDSLSNYIIDKKEAKEIREEIKKYEKTYAVLTALAKKYIQTVQSSYTEELKNRIDFKGGKQHEA